MRGAHASWPDPRRSVSILIQQMAGELGSPNKPYQEKQDDRAQCRGNDVAAGRSRVEPEARGQESSNPRTKNANDDVADEAKAIAFHQQTRQPATAPMTIQAITDSGASMLEASFVKGQQTSSCDASLPSIRLSAFQPTSTHAMGRCARHRLEPPVLGQS